MIKYISGVDGETVLAVKIESCDFAERVNVSPQSEVLQVALIKDNQGKAFRPHRHNPVVRKTIGTQEAWVVIAGRIEMDVYDTDDQKRYTAEVGPGEAIITYNGGHGYRIMEDNTKAVEVKSGPYESVEVDKRFLK